MFKDIKVFLDDNRTNFTYIIENKKIICCINIDIKFNYLDIVYDENIYQITIDKIPVQEMHAGKLRIDNKDITNNTLLFIVEINYKYFIKTIYKYINNFIDKNNLIEELTVFKNSINSKEFETEIDSLINEVKKTNENDKDKIDNILINNKLNLSLEDKLTDLDLMLLITSYISCSRPYKIDQETFNNLVKVAINYDYALENVWRLAMNYDERGFNFELLDEFFVNSKDVWYLAEYLSGVYQVNHEKIVSMIIETKDKDFIKKLTKDFFIQSNLDDKYKEILENALNNL